MEILNWNISYSCFIDNIISLLKRKIEHDCYIITLQEVTEKSYFKLVEEFKESANIYYSLEYRKPGKYDSKGRKLGIAIISSKNIEVNDVGVAQRTLLPERTLFTKCILNGKEFSVLSLHSITGCDHKKAKSLQFNSFAEAVDDLKPTIVTFDANEPQIDHYDVEKMTFFDNKDNGNGAKNFFISLINNNLQDSYSIYYDRDNFVEGNPLVTSHIINNEIKRRYDFVFISKNINKAKTEYFFDEAINASSDHALIKVTI